MWARGFRYVVASWKYLPTHLVYGVKYCSNTSLTVLFNTSVDLLPILARRRRGHCVAGFSKQGEESEVLLVWGHDKVIYRLDAVININDCHVMEQTGKQRAGDLY
jgi:hypothetical protein